MPVSDADPQPAGANVPEGIASTGHAGQKQSGSRTGTAVRGFRHERSAVPAHLPSYLPVRYLRFAVRVHPGTAIQTGVRIVLTSVHRRNSGTAWSVTRSVGADQRIQLPRCLRILVREQVDEPVVGKSRSIPPCSVKPPHKGDPAVVPHLRSHAVEQQGPFGINHHVVRIVPHIDQAGILRSAEQRPHGLPVIRFEQPPEHLPACGRANEQ